MAYTKDVQDKIELVKRAARAQGIPENVVDRVAARKFGVAPKGFQSQKERPEGFLRNVTRGLGGSLQLIGGGLFEGGRRAVSHIARTAGREDIANRVYLDPKTGELVENPFLRQDEIESLSGGGLGAVGTIAKKSAGTASLIPSLATGGMTSALKIGAAGAAGAALQEFSEDDATRDSVGKAAAVGGITSGLLAGAGKLLKGKAAKSLTKDLRAYEKAINESNLDEIGKLAAKHGDDARFQVHKKIPSLAGATKPAGKLTKKASTEAAMRVHKASPSAYRKAVDAGVDPNELVEKYVSKGATYDDLLGNVSKKNKGGILKKQLDEAEKVITATRKAAGSNIKLDGDDIIKGLKAELRTMKRGLGNERKAAALEKIIKAAEKKYSKGVTLNQALDTLRAANKKFGKSIIDDSSDAVVSSAQKLEANVLRGKIKSMFPDIADALDVQSEVLTLRPMLSHARATLNTQGSNLRVSRGGSIPIVSDLVEGQLQKPEVASRFLNKADGGVSKGVVGRVKGAIPSVNAPKGTTGITGQVVGRGINSPTQTTLPTAGELVRTTTGASSMPTPQPQQRGIEIDGVVYTLDDMRRAALIDQMKYGGKNAARFANTIAIMEDMFPEEEPTKPTKLTDKQRSFVGAGEIATEIEQLLEDPETKTGIGRGAIGKVQQTLGTENPAQTRLRSKIASARTIARNALLGANMSEAELESYLDATFDVSLPKEVFKARVRAFIEDMETMAQVGTETPLSVDSLVGQ